MRDAVYLAMTGAAPSIEAALEMDGVMRSAAVIVAKDIEAMRRFEMVQAFSGALSGEK
jgi:hypothetical protein